MGRLWIGTPNGLNQLDRSQGAFTAFTTKDGLPDDAIEAILEDGQGYLWLATHNGLSRFHPSDEDLSQLFRIGWLAGQFPQPVWGGERLAKSRR